MLALKMYFTSYKGDKYAIECNAVPLTLVFHHLLLPREAYVCACLSFVRSIANFIASLLRCTVTVKVGRRKKWKGEKINWIDSLLLSKQEGAMLEFFKVQYLHCMYCTTRVQKETLFLSPFGHLRLFSSFYYERLKNVVQLPNETDEFRSVSALLLPSCFLTLFTLLIGAKRTN